MILLANKFNMINSLKLRILSIFLTATLIFGSGSLFLSESARAAASLQGGDFMQAFNNTTQEGTWRDPVSANPGDVIEFRVTVRNNGDTPARDVQVWGSVTGQVPQDPAQQLVITGKINDPDAASSITDTATVNINGNTPVGMRYYPGHARINGVTDIYNCPNTCNISDNGVLGGFEIGDIAPGDFAELTFKASLSAITPTPTPTPTPTITPTPTPTVSVTPTPTPTPTVTITPTPTPTISITPTPTPTVSVTPTPTPTVTITPTPTPPQGSQTITLKCPDGRDITVIAGENANVNTLCQSQQQQQTQNNTQTNTQTQTATTGSSSSSSSSNVTVNNPAPAVITTSATQVAGVTAVKELPKTGLPLLVWAAAAFLPAGYKLRKLGSSGQILDETANFIWEEREFKKN